MGTTDTMAAPLEALAQRLGVALTPRGKHSPLVAEAAQRAGLDLADFPRYGVGEVMALVAALAHIVDGMAGKVRTERRLHNTGRSLDVRDIPTAVGPVPAAAGLAVAAWSAQVVNGVCPCGAALTTGAAGHRPDCAVVANVGDVAAWLLDAS